MSRYTDIFFDLDRTIWDFDKNSAETLFELYEAYNLQQLLQTNFENFLGIFRKINAVAWAEFRNGEKTKEEMREDRFVQTFFHFGCQDWKLARKLNEVYIEISPAKPHLMDGAVEVLEALKDSFRLHIISNGFSDTQRTKIGKTGIEKYFLEIIISDETPYRKPQAGIFKLAMERAGTSAAHSLMIGDDWHKDILGAKNAKMDQVYFNTERELVRHNRPTFQIENLRELKRILLA